MANTAVLPLFDVEIQPRWADQDPMGHINHVQYFRYLEEARVQWIVDSNLGATSSAGQFGMIMANIGLNFRKEWHHPGALRATAYVTNIGNTSFRLQQYLHAADSGDLVAEGEATLVWVDMKSHKPEPLHDEIRVLLKRHQLAVG